MASYDRESVVESRCAHMSNDYQVTITRLLAELKGGNKEAMTGIWNEYFGRLMQVARNVMSNRPKRASNEEDIVVSVFGRLWENVQKGSIPNLNRRQLWYLLLKMTHDKLADHARYGTRIKRGGGQADESLVDEIVSQEPTPEFIAIMNETWQRLLEGLGDEALLRRVAIHDFEGDSAQEIADKLGVSARTVARKLELIRSKWEQQLEENGNGPGAKKT